MHRHQPQNLLGPGPVLQEACSSLGPSLTHQWADASCNKTVALEPVDQALPVAGQTLPCDLLGSGPVHQQANISFKIPESRSQLFQEPALPTSDLTPALGPLCSATRPQDMVLPASRLTLAPGLASSTTVWAVALGSPGP